MSNYIHLTGVANLALDKIYPTDQASHYTDPTGSSLSKTLKQIKK